MEIKTIKINNIIPYHNNAKEHTEEQIEQLKNSIKEFGNNDPIAIDENNVIIEGHGRLMALKDLGFTEVECIVLTGLTEEQKNAYRIVHNQLTMNTGWDLDKLKSELNNISLDMLSLGLTEDLLDFTQEDLENVEDDNFDIDEALEEIDEPITKLGDVWVLDKHKLLCGDATKQEDVLKLMDGAKADLYLTDPPYNVNVSNSQGMTIQNDNMSNKQFYEFLKAAFSSANENLKEGGAFYIWHADSEGYNFRGACYEIGWQVRQCLIWVKNNFNLGRQDYQWKHESCLYGWKEGAAHYFINDRTQSTIIEDKIDLNKLKKEEMLELLKELLSDKIPTTVIHEDKPLIDIDHPTMKPIKLISRLVANSSRKQDKVLDTFGGSGSTLIACEQLQRQCYMMELDPKYCDVIVKRWEALTGKKAVLLK